MIEEDEAVQIINNLYMMMRKQKRVNAKKQTFYDLEIDEEN
jgi:hypothetical protein